MPPAPLGAARGAACGCSGCALEREHKVTELGGAEVTSGRCPPCSHGQCPAGTVNEGHWSEQRPRASMCSRFTAPGMCLRLAEHPRPCAAQGALLHRALLGWRCHWCLVAQAPGPKGHMAGAAGLGDAAPWGSTHGMSSTGWAMRRRGQYLALCRARRRLGGSSGAGAMQAHPGWVLQGSHACVSGGTGANPCGMPWPGERGRPRRLGAGRVGFQGSCRAGAATGTDGGRAGPAPPWGSWLGLEVLAVPTALPWPQVLLSLWTVGQGRSCPGLCAWL